MLNLDNLKKQAKLLVRWHREGNYSIGERDQEPAALSEANRRGSVGAEVPAQRGARDHRVGRGLRELGGTQDRACCRAEASETRALRT